MSVDHTAIHLKEQLEKYKYAIGESLFGDGPQMKSFNRSKRFDSKKGPEGRNQQALSTQ